MSSPGGYIVYPIARSSVDILDDAYAAIKSRAPEWQENDGNLDVWILQVTASQAADLLSLAHDVPEAIFQYYGNNLMGIPPLDATPAQVDSTWTMKDAAGYTVPAGTQVSIRGGDGQEHAFSTLLDFTVVAGQTATAAGAITLQSNETGDTLTGLGGAGYIATLIDTLEYVASVVLTEAASGGQSAETPSQYNDRLARKLQRLSSRPVLASDFSLAAFDVPGVYRTLALDGYNPGNQTYNNERYVAIAAVDELGQAASAGVKSSLQAYLDSQREVNFVVNVFDPTYTNIDVTFNVKCMSGFTTESVRQASINRITDFLVPYHWGLDPSLDQSTSQLQSWVQINKVIYNKIIQILAASEGVDYVIDVTIGISGQALGRTDLTLAGAAPLTRPGTINGTATA